MCDVAALVLAAGQGSRFGAGTESKVLALLQGVPLVTQVAAAALASQATPVIVVTGRAAAEVEAALAGLAISIAHNPHHEAGMAGSLAVGLQALPAQSTGVLVLLADMPMVRVATLDRLIDCFKTAAADTEAVVPVFEGRPGNPVLIARAMFAEVAGLSGDQGARKLLAAPGRKIVQCEVDDDGVLIDIDTRDALDQAADRSFS